MKKSSPKGSFFFLDFFFLTFRPRDFPSDPSSFQPTLTPGPSKPPFPPGQVAVSPHPAALPLRRFQAARGQFFPFLTPTAIAQGASSSASGFRGPLACPSFTSWAARPLRLAPRCPTSSGFHSRAAYPGAPNRLPAVPSVPGSLTHPWLQVPPNLPSPQPRSPLTSAVGAELSGPSSELASGVLGASAERSASSGRRRAREGEPERRLEPARLRAGIAPAPSAPRRQQRPAEPELLRGAGRIGEGAGTKPEGNRETRREAKAQASESTLGRQGVLMKMGEFQWGC